MASSMAPKGRHVALILSITILGGCQEPEVAPKVPAALAVKLGDAFLIDRSPLFIAGEADENAPPIGLASAVGADSKGNVYVLDKLAQDIKVYASDGTFRRLLAGPGRGPGELHATRSLSVGNDTVFIHGDVASFFAVTGEYLGSSAPELGVFPFAAKSWHTSKGLMVRTTARGTRSKNRLPLAFQLRTYDVSSDSFGQLIATVPDTFHVLGMGMEGPVLMGGSRFVTTDETGVVHVTSKNRLEVVRLAPNGDTIGRISFRAPQVRTSEQDYIDHLAWWREYILRASSRTTQEDLKDYVKALERAPRAQHRPPIGAILTGPAGTLLQRFDVSERPYARYDTLFRSEWSWLSKADSPIARLMLPNAFTPHTFNDCLVLGVMTMPMGEDQVRAYSLERPGHTCVKGR